MFRRDATRVSLAYRYHNPKWDLARNLEVYGDTHNVEGIGANLTVWLEVKASPDAKTQLVIPEKSLNAHLAKAKELLDHRCLFEVEPWFQENIPTLENIALFLTQKIWAEPPPAGVWHSIIVEENEFWRVQVFPNEPNLHLTYSYQIGALKLLATIASPLDFESGLVESRAKVVDDCQSVDWCAPTIYWGQLGERLPSLVSLRIEQPKNQAIQFSVKR